MAKKRVLVVDDSHTQRVILDTILTKAGYDVVCAEDGEEALLELDDQLFIGDCHFNYMIMDIAMPKLDGYGLIRKLARRKGRRPAVILMSDKGQPILDTAVELASAYGLTLMGAISKPIRASEIETLMDELVQVRQRDKDASFTCLAGSSFLAGLAGDALTVAYQPKIACENGKVAGAECLARWRTSRGGILSPAVFLPTARKMGYLSGVTHKILMQGLSDYKEWHREGHTIGLCINITASDACDLAFADFVRDLLAEYQVAPEHLTLELTESELVEDMAIGMEVLGRLRLLGVDLALDDFGAGFDPFLRLNNMPFSELKSDQPFLQNAAVNNRSRIILEMSVEMARRMNIASTCEGVETADQWQRICALGATYGQGHFMAAPMLAPDFKNWLSEWDGGHLLQKRSTSVPPRSYLDSETSDGRSDRTRAQQSYRKGAVSPEPAVQSHRRTDLL
ncbi:MAG: EAL domain-containing protein [Alphaproteobacteria bacterium]|nr:EAL domain-containing protein [Alphaproteobacteria bacterium]